jgi:hypothetical protein
MAVAHTQSLRAAFRWFARASGLDGADARDMAGWVHCGGFSVDASVRIECVALKRLAAIPHS